MNKATRAWFTEICTESCLTSVQLNIYLMLEQVWPATQQTIEVVFILM